MVKKKQRNKALLVTATAFTLGLTGFGTTGLVQKPIEVHANNTTLSSVNDLFKWSFSKGPVTTFVKDLQVTPNHVVKVSTLEGDNRKGSSEQSFKSIKSTYKTVDSITNTYAKEFSFGQKLSGELSAPPFSKVSTEITAGQKFTDTTAKLQSTEKTIEYGGDELKVPAGQYYQLKYVYSYSTYKAKFQNQQELTRPGGTSMANINVDYKDANGQKHNDKSYANLNNIDTSTAYGLVKALKTVYDYETGYQDLTLLSVNFQFSKGNGDWFKLSAEDLKKNLLDKVVLDDNEKKVYILNDAVDISGESGNGDQITIERHEMNPNTGVLNSVPYFSTPQPGVKTN